MNPSAQTSRPLLEYLQKAASFLAERGVESPRLSAELLLAHLLQASRLDLYLRFEEPLSEAVVAAYRQSLRRRAAHEPVAYLLGRREFYGREFGVDARVLIPRPETEHLVERALAFMRARPPGRLLDVGTGSGILACTLLLECCDWSGLAVDISLPALEVARANAERHDLTGRVEFRAGSVYAPLSGGEKFDLIVSNPPYIRINEWENLPEQVKGFEPAQALLAGDDGLLVLRPLLAEAPARLTAGGMLVCELGETQSEAVIALARQAGLVDAEVAPDLAGKPRVLSARRAEE